MSRHRSRSQIASQRETEMSFVSDRDDPFYFHYLRVRGKKLRVYAAQLAALVLVPITDLQKRGANPSRIVDIESRATPTNDLAIVSSSRGGEALRAEDERRLFSSSPVGVCCCCCVSRTPRRAQSGKSRQRRLSKARAWLHSLLFM
jgi:hypothetical protein